jgi:ferrous iron transport protein B
MKKTWVNLKDFVYTAFPLIIIGNFVIQVSNAAGLLSVLQSFLSPVTVLWLGLPAVTGVVLVFGILRKEMTIILLASLMGTTNFALVMTPVQIFVFAFVVMIYVPCLATIAVLAREFGLKRAAIISIVEVTVAIVLGGILYHVLSIFGFV